MTSTPGPTVEELTAQLNEERSCRAAAESALRHGLSLSELAIVGTFGTPEQIDARAQALAAALADVRGPARHPAQPAPGIPGIVYPRAAVD